MNKPKQNIECHTCGTIFLPTNGRQKYCCVQCRIEGRAIKRTTGCWEFQGSVTFNGYGRIGLNGRAMLAHRTMYESLFGELPDDIFVCHKCDNRLCVNPDHLFAGTRKENMEDAANKKRMPHGINHPNAKLTEQMVREIRKSKKPIRKLAKEYGVGATAIHKARVGEYWSHIE